MTRDDPTGGRPADDAPPHEPAEAPTEAPTEAPAEAPTEAPADRDRAGEDRADGLDDELVVAAREAMARAYCPYSRYPVGAAVRTESGSVHAGCNVENAAFPLGNCAEAAALAAMVLAGERRVTDVVTVTRGPTPGTPCGGCRQRIREFAAPGAVVRATTVDGASITTTLEELLPRSFGPADLDQKAES